MSVTWSRQYNYVASGHVAITFRIGLYVDDKKFKISCCIRSVVA